ncbi:ArsR/SmtB family transcription factor [Nonomuraea sp. NPDC049400]|uniref:ArsR/SmtB family transcription factor n=1 Tax=Nonomuraea sp. NPDC049400 TaxID=3364352 RepID=UPI0037B2A2AE
MSSINTGFPDYDLEERKVVTAPHELRAIADPFRGILLDLLLERAATVSELAQAVGRPKSTVAHHVKVLLDAGFLRVVRTRRVRAIEESFYGRTARNIYVGKVRPEDVTPPPWPNELADAAEESMPAYLADRMRALRHHVSISERQAAEFWERVIALLNEFDQLPREGDIPYSFVVSLYPAEHPTLPPAAP